MANVFDQFDSTSESSNPFDQFDSTGQEPKSVHSPTPVSEERPRSFVANALIPSLVEQVKGALPGMKVEDTSLVGIAKDVGKGLVETGVGLASGLGQFVGSTIGGIPGLTKALPSQPGEEFSPARGLAAAKETGEALVKPLEFTPTTATANVLLSPFTVGFGTVLDSIGRFVKDIHGPDADPQLVENRAKGAQYLFNAALLASPLLKSKLERGVAPTPEEVSTATESAISSVTEQVPELKGRESSLMEALSTAKAVGTEVTPKVSVEGVHPFNAEIASVLRERANTEKGPKAARLRRTASIVESYGESLDQVPSGTKIGGVGPSTWKLIDERRSKVEPEVGPLEDVPIEQPKPIEEVPTDAESLRRDEEQVPEGRIVEEGSAEEGGQDLQLQTEEGTGAGGEEAQVASGLSPEMYAKRELYTEEDFFRDLNSKPTVSVPEVRKTVRIESPNVEVKEFSSVEDASGDYTVMSKIPGGEKQAVREILYDINDEGKAVEKDPRSPFTAVKIGEDYYRVIEKGKFPLTEPLEMDKGFGEVRAPKVETPTWESREEAIGAGAVHPIFDDVQGSPTEGKWFDVGRILGNQKGSIPFGHMVESVKKFLLDEEGSYKELDPEQLKVAVDQMKTLVSKAKKAGMSFEDWVKGQGFSEGVSKELLDFHENFGEAKKAVREVLKLQLRPEGRLKNRVEDETVSGIKRMYEGPSQAIADQVRYLESVGSIVPDYVEGSGKLYERKRPLIKETDPEVKAGFEDIPVRIGESPHNVMGRAFELMNNAVPDAFEGHMSLARNVSQGMKWAKDVLKGVESSEELLKRELLPVYEKYGPVISERVRVEARISGLERTLKNIPKTSTERRASLGDRIAAAKGRLVEIDEKLKPLSGEFDSKMQEIAPKSGDVRIALYAGDALPEGVSLSPAEKLVGDRIKEFMNKTGEDLQGVGIPVIHDRAYMSHLWGALMEDEGAKSFFKTSSKVPAVMKFMHQLPEGRMWTPSATMILNEYIPMVERKLAYQPFLNRWSEFANSNDYPKLQQYMREWIKDNLYKKSESMLDVGANALIGLEYMRLIGLSLSVGAKHLMKLPQTWAKYDLPTVVQSMGAELKVPVQLLAERLGIPGERNELRLVRAFVNSRDLVQTLDNVSTLKQMVNSTRTFKDVMSQPVIAIEALDNGVSVLASTIAGAKKGAAFDRVHNQIWHTVLDSNFRGGWDQPLWQKSTGARVASMFQSTPFKMLEYKGQLIERALKGERDAFGTHYGTQLIRYLAYIGLAETVALANGVDIKDWFLHIPFISSDTGGVFISPLIDWAGKTKEKGLIGGTAQHFGSADVVKSVNFLKKLDTMSSEQYPHGAYDSPLKELFGLKRTGYEYVPGKGPVRPRERRESRRREVRRR